MIFNAIGGSGGGGSSDPMAFEKGTVLYTGNVTATTDYFNTYISQMYINSLSNLVTISESFAMSITAQTSVGNTQIEQILTYPCAYDSSNAMYLQGVVVLGNGNRVGMFYGTSSVDQSTTSRYVVIDPSRDTFFATGYFSSSQSTATNNGFSTSATYTVEIFTPALA